MNAYPVPERIATGRVVVDPHGRAIPFDIPADAQDPGAEKLFVTRFSAP